MDGPKKTHPSTSRACAPWVKTHSRRRALFSRVRVAKRTPARLKLRRRPRNIPRYWRRIDQAGLFAAENSGPTTGRLRRLVLASQRIPFLEADADRLYAPPLYVLRANSELRAYINENRPRPSPLLAPAYRNAPLVLMVQLFLVVWYGVTVQWWPGTDPLPTFTAWKAMGSLDVFRVLHRQEWWRCVTALTLHADAVHLFANAGFGAPFMVMLAKRTGVGPAILLILLAGVAGNVLSAFYRPLSHNSLGFSTALFGCVGLLAGMAASRASGKGRFLLPPAAGAGILALLGTGGGDGAIDYGAHIFGLVGGLVLGWMHGMFFFSRPAWPFVARAGCMVAAMVIVAGAWGKALGL